MDILSENLVHFCACPEPTSLNIYPSKQYMEQTLYRNFANTLYAPSIFSYSVSFTLH